MEPASGVTLFWGENAQGKTNLLEAVYYLVTGRSFRTRQDRETLPWGASPDAVSTIQGTVQTPSSTYRITVAISKNRKCVSCNEKTLSSLGLLWGKMNAVLFTPDDLDIVKGPPGLRRRFLDMEGSQIDHSYLYHLQRYNQVLRQRNALLKTDVEMEGFSETLDVWDEQMAKPAVEIFLFRKRFLEQMAEAARETYTRITDSTELLDLSYEHFLKPNQPDNNKPTLEALYKKELRRHRAEDVYRGVTGCGPHRDDFRILINDQDSRTYGSQGQQRSAMIALRLAEIDLMRKYTGHTPLLLLDDVASELDEGRRRRFLALLNPELQTFITGTDADTFRGELPVEKSFHIHDGAIL